MLRTITKDELKIILDNHTLWLNNKGGSKANLRFANLSSANLRSANLSYANLRYADLSFANLSSADLSSADLDKKYVQISCIGSRKGITTYCIDDDFIWCACWTGNIKDFEKRVRETHKENKQYLKEYLGAIKYFKSLK